MLRSRRRRPSSRTPSPASRPGREAAEEVRRALQGEGRHHRQRQEVRPRHTQVCQGRQGRREEGVVSKSSRLKAVDGGGAYSRPLWRLFDPISTLSLYINEALTLKLTLVSAERYSTTGGTSAAAGSFPRAVIMDL